MHTIRHITVIFLLLFSWGLMTCVPAMAQNAPVSTIGIVSSYTTTATVPVTAMNVSNIGSFSIKITYDPAIVHPVAVTGSPLIGGTLSVNLSNPGVIFLSWFTYPGLTLGGNPVILNIDFTRISFGSSALTWFDDGYSCAWYDGNSASLNDAPTASYYIGGSLSFVSPDAPHTIIPPTTACPGTTAGIPVMVTGFNNIGQVSLTLTYDMASLAYQDFTNASGFPGLAVDGIQPGTLTITGIISTGGTGFTLSDSATLLILNFTYSGGPANLTWFDNGVSCQHAGPPPSFFILNDSPQNDYYINGSVSQIPLPAAAGVITGPPGGDVCAGQTGVVFSVSPIQHADTYSWTIPPGAAVTSGAMTNSIIVAFGNLPGSWDITVCGSNTCGGGPGSPAFPVNVNTPPNIAVQPVSPGTVNAGNGSASFMVEATGSLLTYQWQEFTTTWSDLANGGSYGGVMTPALTITNPPVAMNGNHYRCIVNGFCLPQAVSDGEATLTVSNLTGIEVTEPGENGTKDQLMLGVHPNPATLETTIAYQLPDDGFVTLEIYSIYGKRIHVLCDGFNARGSHKLRIPVQLNTGIYMLTLSFKTTIKAYRTTTKLIFE